MTDPVNEKPKTVEPPAETVNPASWAAPPEAAVAKAPIIKNESGQDLTSTYDIGDVIKTGDGSHKMKIALDVEASGEEQITLLMTNLPSSLSDYLSFENAQGTAIGAKNKLLDVIVSAIFTIISVVLILGLSDKIYL